MTSGNRSFERKDVRTSAGVIEGQEGGRALLGLSRDISLSGVFVECNDPPAVDSQVQLILGSSTPALRAFARVVRVGDGGFGAVFLDDRDQARHDVETFVAKCKEQQQSAPS